MPAEKLYRAYKVSGWVALLLFLCGFAALVDGLITEMRLGPNRLDVLPASTLPLSGPIPIKDATKEDFAVEGSSSSNEVEIKLDDFFSSYWFGSGMWRGQLVVGEKPGIGDYFFIVRFRGAPEKSAQFYHVAVWENATAMRKASFSFVMRTFGVSPFWTAGFIIPLGLIAGFINFIFGRIWVKNLNKSGIAEVFKVVRPKGAEKIEVAFGLGAEHGMQIGQEFMIFQPYGSFIGQGQVELLEPKYSAVMLPANCNKVTSGCVAIPADYTGLQKEEK